MYWNALHWLDENVKLISLGFNVSSYYLFIIDRWQWNVITNVIITVFECTSVLTVNNHKKKIYSKFKKLHNKIIKPQPLGMVSRMQATFLFWIAGAILLSKKAASFSVPCDVYLYKRVYVLLVWTFYLKYVYLRNTTDEFKFR